MRTRRKKTRIRKSTKYVYIAIAIVLMIASFFNLLKNISGTNMGTSTKQIYSYTNRFNYDYDVILIPNKYIDGMEKTDKNIAYVTDLIDNTRLMLNYEYYAQTKSELIYEYEVTGRMQAVYTKDGEEQKILENTEVLLDKTTKTEFANNFKIEEELTLDLKEKNNLLNEFKQKMGMSIDAVYTITLNINVKTNVEGKEIVSSYSPTIELDLAEKTTKISGENNKEDTQYISKEYKTESKNDFMIIVDIIGLVAAVCILRYVTKAKVTNVIRNEYRQELNRILKLCQDKIVQVSTKPDATTENTVYVKDFGEIVKLSEELFKPILYYFDQDKEEACFSVMSNQVIYQYVLKK